MNIKKTFVTYLLEDVDRLKEENHELFEQCNTLKEELDRANIKNKLLVEEITKLTAKPIDIPVEECEKVEITCKSCVNFGEKDYCQSCHNYNRYQPQHIIRNCYSCKFENDPRENEPCLSCSGHKEYTNFVFNNEKII